MKETHTIDFKDWIDKFLVFNLFVIITGFFLFLIGVLFSMNGNNGFYIDEQNQQLLYDALSKSLFLTEKEFNYDDIEGYMYE